MYHEYETANGRVITRNYGGMRLNAKAEIQDQQDLLKDQLGRSCAQLLDQIGTERYLAWVDENIDDKDGLGQILTKIDNYLVRLTCGECPFDFDPSQCSMCHERAL